MSENNSLDSLPGQIFIGNLTITFIVLKLTGIITWSWIWVLSPLWIPTAFIVITFIIVFLIVMFCPKLVLD